MLNEFEQTVIEVAGHTDSTGTDAYNQQLSERRASAVAAYLRTRSVRARIDHDVGEGEARPVASNDTDGRAAAEPPGGAHARPADAELTDIRARKRRARRGATRPFSLASRSGGYFGRRAPICF